MGLGLVAAFPVARVSPWPVEIAAPVALPASLLGLHWAFHVGTGPAVGQQEGEGRLAGIAALNELIDAVEQVRIPDLGQLAFAKIAVFAEPVVHVPARAHPVGLARLSSHALTLAQIAGQPVSIVQIAALGARPAAQRRNDRHYILGILERTGHGGQ